MNVELLINSSAAVEARYIGWAPTACRLRLSDSAGATAPFTVQLRQKPSTTGGRFQFRGTLNGASANSLNATLPLNGNPVSFFLLGQFGRPSLADGDAVVQVRRGTQVLLEVPIMVRIRKNAESMTTAERDRFIAAFARFNDQGQGRFREFRNMHTAIADPEAHQGPGFLAWHRAYLVDLERELQALDRSVSLPYWRFDRAAPRLFTREFFGVSNSNGTVQFSATNPLQFWRTDGVPGVSRTPDFNPTTTGAFVSSEADTLALGAQFSAFRSMEGDPHGFAHTSFGGSISQPQTAPRDPLFFLLHANVDRLWAKWQRNFGRFNPTAAGSFVTTLNRVGHNLADTMWPWNQVTTPPRPSVAPGGTLRPSPCATAPGLAPRVRDVFDFQGAVTSTARMGFDYDDVRFV